MLDSEERTGMHTVHLTGKLCESRPSTLWQQTAQQCMFASLHHTLQIPQTYAAHCTSSKQNMRCGRRIEILALIVKTFSQNQLLDKHCRYYKKLNFLNYSWTPLWETRTGEQFQYLIQYVSYKQETMFSLTDQLLVQCGHCTTKISSK